MKRLRMALACAMLVACARQPKPVELPPAPELQQCRVFFDRVDGAVRAAQVEDGEAHRITGFPYLRVDRLLASFAGELGAPQRFEAWRARLRELDHAARAAELANLDIAQRLELASDMGRDPAPAGLNRQLDRCAVELMRDDDRIDARRVRLRERAAAVPDDYDGWKRVVGVYWLARLPFAHGVEAYQREVRETFAQPLAMLPLQGRLTYYLPPAATGVTIPPPHVDVDALGIPLPSAAQLDALFAAYAPVWIVDRIDDDDRIGALKLDDTQRVDVDVGRPVTYQRLAFTRFGGDVLMQLVYSVWFPERPKTSASDLLGGHLDSVVWRVTLDRAGRPLLFDSMHGCGCYHQFFPTARLRLRQRHAGREEGALVPQTLPALEATQRVAVRLAAHTHYIERVLVDAPIGEPAYSYVMLPDESLRTLPAPGGGSRSAFRPDGIVAGSERGERFLFWPMGVRDPGAMRQWGRHATAFLGRRHFDEARLIERYFEAAP